jgi:hypothetical protein
MITNIQIGAEVLDLAFKGVGWVAIICAGIYTLFLINTWVRYSFTGMGAATLGIHGLVMFVTISTLLTLMNTL